MNCKKKEGITLISLVITIIILSILAGVSIVAGVNGIKKVELEELETNMLLIEAKAREYVEETNFAIGKETDVAKIAEIKEEEYETKGKLAKASEEGITNSNISNISECYVVTEETLSLWGLDKIKLVDDEYYLIYFDESNLSVEVYNTKGYDGKYSLTDIKQE